MSWLNLLTMAAEYIETNETSSSTTDRKQDTSTTSTNNENQNHTTSTNVNESAQENETCFHIAPPASYVRALSSEDVELLKNENYGGKTFAVNEDKNKSDFVTLQPRSQNNISLTTASDAHSWSTSCSTAQIYQQSPSTYQDQINQQRYQVTTSTEKSHPTSTGHQLAIVNRSYQPTTTIIGHQNIYKGTVDQQSSISDDNNKQLQIYSGSTTTPTAVEQTHFSNKPIPAISSYSLVADEQNSSVKPTWSNQLALTPYNSRFTAETRAQQPQLQLIAPLNPANRKELAITMPMHHYPASNLHQVGRGRGDHANRSPSVRPVSLTHNQLEKNRRAHLKGCFEKLREKIPRLGVRRSSNLTILKSALKHIQGLKKKSDDLLKKKELLIKEVKVRQAYHDRICNNLIEIHGVSAVSEYLEKSITEMRRNPRTLSSSSIIADDEDTQTTSTASEAEEEELRASVRQITSSATSISSASTFTTNHQTTTATILATNKPSTSTITIKPETPSTSYLPDTPSTNHMVHFLSPPTIQHPSTISIATNQPVHTTMLPAPTRQLPQPTNQSQVLYLNMLPPHFQGTQQSLLTNPSVGIHKQPPQIYRNLSSSRQQRIVYPHASGRSATPSPPSNRTSWFSSFGTSGSPPLHSEYENQSYTVTKQEVPKLTNLTDVLKNDSESEMKAVPYSSSDQTRSSDASNKTLGSINPVVSLPSFSGYEVKVKYLPNASVPNVTHSQTNSSAPEVTTASIVTTCPSSLSKPTIKPVKNDKLSTVSTSKTDLTLSIKPDKTRSPSSRSLNMTSLYVAASVDNLGHSYPDSDDQDQVPSTFPFKRFSSSNELRNADRPTTTANNTRHWRKRLVSNERKGRLLQQQKAESQKTVVSQTCPRHISSFSFPTTSQSSVSTSSNYIRSEEKRKTSTSAEARFSPKTTISGSCDNSGCQKTSTSVPASSLTSVCYTTLQRPSLPTALLVGKNNPEVTSSSATQPPFHAAEPVSATTMQSVIITHNLQNRPMTVPAHLTHPLQAIPTTLANRQVTYQFVQPAIPAQQVLPSIQTTSNTIFAPSPINYVSQPTTADNQQPRSTFVALPHGTGVVSMQPQPAVMLPFGWLMYHPTPGSSTITDPSSSGPSVQVVRTSDIKTSTKRPPDDSHVTNSEVGTKHARISTSVSNQVLSQHVVLPAGNSQPGSVVMATAIPGQTNGYNILGYPLAAVQSASGQHVHAVLPPGTSLALTPNSLMQQQ